MPLLQNEYFDLFDPCFIRFEWNTLTVTPSVMCFTNNSEADNNHQFVVVPHNGDLNEYYDKVHIRVCVVIIIKNGSEVMPMIVVFQKYCCDFRRTSKYHDRKDEHACNGRDKIVK